MTRLLHAPTKSYQMFAELYKTPPTILPVEHSLSKPFLFKSYEPTISTVVEPDAHEAHAAVDVGSGIRRVHA